MSRVLASGQRRQGLRCKYSVNGRHAIQRWQHYSRSDGPSSASRQHSLSDCLSLGAFHAPYRLQQAFLGEPDLQGVGYERWNCSQNSQRSIPPRPTKPNGGPKRHEKVKDECGTVQASKQPNADIGRVKVVLQNHADQQSRPGKGFNAGGEYENLPGRKQSGPSCWAGLDIERDTRSRSLIDADIRSSHRAI